MTLIRPTEGQAALAQQTNNTGELIVLLNNSSKATKNIAKGDRIAQLVLYRVETSETCDVVEVGEERVTDSVRQDSGFGSSGA